MTGVILFRAQPFHNGHLAQIKRAYKDIEKFGGNLYVIVGSADKHGTKRNPIPISTRLDLIMGALKDEFKSEELQRIHVVPFNDLSDEANNTYSWGDYLYEKLCEITYDKDFVFYYSDKPEIMLSWFDDITRMHLWFKFLPRHEGVNATAIRKCLREFTDYDKQVLKAWLPQYVYEQRNVLHRYICSAD